MSITGLCHGQDIIKYKVDDFVNVRCEEEKEAQGRFNVFFDKLVPCVAGRKLWSKQAMVTDSVTKSGKVTVMDEAFVELCILNYFEKWINGGRTHWTNERGDSSNFQGWSEEAYFEFDRICLRISTQRKSGRKLNRFS